MVAGGDTGEELHRGWPNWWARPNVTASGPRWADFAGFQSMFDPGPHPALSDRGLLVVLPTLRGGGAAGRGRPGAGDAARFGLTSSVANPADCAEQMCALYPSWYVHQTAKLRAGVRATFVSILVPHGPGEAVAAVADSATAILGEDGIGITVGLAVGGVTLTLRASVANSTTRSATPWRVGRAASGRAF